MKKEDEIIGGEKSYIPTKEKTVTIPESQLVMANKLVDKINILVKELKDYITVTY